MDRTQRKRLRRTRAGRYGWLSKRRVKVVLALTLLAILALASFTWASQLATSDKYAQLFYQVSADLVSVILTLTVVAPLLQTALREDVALRDRLDLDSFVELVDERGHQSVSILDSFSMVLAPNRRYRLIYPALLTALGRGATVRVLLLDPSCTAAARRHDQLAANFAQRGLPEPREVMWQSVRQLRDFQQNLPSEWRERLEIGFTTIRPVMHIYQCDKLAHISFPRGERPSNFERQLEVDVARADIWVMASDHLNELWLGATSLDQYVELPLRVALGEAELSVSVEYVHHHGSLFVYNEALVGRITEALLARRIDKVHAALEAGGDAQYAIGALNRESADQRTFHSVSVSFLRKYGVERNTVLSMTPLGPGSPAYLRMETTEGPAASVLAESVQYVDDGRPDDDHKQ